MKLPYDELRDGIIDRSIEPRIDPSGRRSVVITVRFATPLSAGLRAILEEELHHSSAVRSERIVGPIQVELTRDHAILELLPLDPEAVRLDTLLSALAFSGSPLGSPLSARVLVDLAEILEAIHNSIGPDGSRRVHNEIHAGTILIGSGGNLTLVGDGLRGLCSLLIRPLKSDVDRARFLSPEARRGEALDPRSDVYSLGVLYFELLAGRRYREADFPAALPDPREGLVRILRMALDPDRDRRLADVASLRDAVLADLATAKIALPTRELLERFIAEFVPAGADRGDDVLAAVEHDPAVFEALMSGAAETYPTPPAHDPASTPKTPPSTPAPHDHWSRVLGQTFEDDPPTVPSRAAEPVPSPPVNALPLPDDVPTINQPRMPEPLVADRIRPLPKPLDRSGPSDGGPRPARAEPSHEPSSALRFALSAAGLLLVVAVGYGLWTRPTPEELDPEPVDAGTIAVAAPMDASIALASADAGPAAPLGLLSVLSKPSGAAVELDGGYIGKTPLVLKHELELRSYRLTIRSDGYVPWEKLVRPDRSLKSISVMATLEPIP